MKKKKITMPRMGVFWAAQKPFRLTIHHVHDLFIPSSVGSVARTKENAHSHPLTPSSSLRQTTAYCILTPKKTFSLNTGLHNKGNNDTLKSAQFGPKKASYLNLFRGRVKKSSWLWSYERGKNIKSFVPCSRCRVHPSAARGERRKKRWK